MFSRARHRKSKSIALLITPLLMTSLFAPAVVLSTAERASATTCDPAGSTYPAATDNSGFGGGLGTTASPWLICSVAQLTGISTNSSTLDGEYLLTQSLDLGGSSSPWTPIGQTFTGVFDGNGLEISNLYGTSASGTTFFGLFHTLSGAGTSVKNLSVSGEFQSTYPTGDIFNSNQRVGLLAAKMQTSASISKIQVKSAKFGGHIRYLGGAVGELFSSSLNQVKVTGLDLTIPKRDSRGNIGGVVGYSNAGNLFRLSASGTISGSPTRDYYNDFYLGGLAGDLTNGSVLDQSSSEVNWLDEGAPAPTVFSAYGSGALVGQLDSSTLRDSVVVSQATSRSLFGGAVGTFRRATITATRILSVVTATSVSGNPVVTTNANNLSATASFFNRESWGDAAITEDQAIFGFTAKSTSALKQKSLYDAANWRIFDSGSAAVTTDWSESAAGDPIWKISNSTSYPSLVWLDHWPIQSKTITFKANFSAGAADTTQVVNKFQTTALSANAFVRPGHTFSHWATTADGSGTSYEDQESFTAQEDTILFAQWKANDESVHFDIFQRAITPGPSLARPGDQIWASAIERVLSRELFRSNVQSDNLYSTPEEYAYRITKLENNLQSSVDPQSFADYEGLTALEQEAWYESMNYDQSDPDNDYEFSWSAFVCLDDTTQEISLPTNYNYSYATREKGILAGDSFETAVNTFFRDALSDFPGLTTRTMVGDNRGNAFLGENYQTPLALSDISGTCAAGTSFQGLRIVTNASEENSPVYVVSKSLTISDKLTLWDATNEVPVEMPAEGLTVGVTGGFSFNAALWGLTTIAAREVSSPGSASKPYEGPLNVKLPTGTVCSSSEVIVTGERLSTIGSVQIGSKEAAFRLLPNGNLSISLSGITPNRYQVKLWVPNSNVFLTHEFVVADCPNSALSNPLGKINVGSFNGKLVVYAQNLDGKRISWKVGGNWGTATAVGNTLNRFDRPTPRRGVTVSVQIYVDGVLTLTKSVVTR